jgi:chemotaxis regulatin CheY-phosphate phosphatase CheZ
MSENTAMNVDLREVQEKVEDSVKQAQDFGRKAVLATVGMWGLAYDKAEELWKAGVNLVDKAEKRGEEVEQEWVKQFDKMQENPEVKKVVVYVEDHVDVVSKNAKGVVAEVEKFLGQFQPKVEEAAKDVVIKVESAIDAVVPGYDELSAKDVVAKLGELPKVKLVEIREYEIKNKNRVTVIREIDAMLEAPETVAA